MSPLDTKLKLKFTEKQYAHSYMQAHVVTKIASQLLTIRKSRNWTQQHLAKLSSISQEKISYYENGDFTSITLRTLFKLAEALDVSLNVAFTEFSKTITDISNFSELNLTVIDREEDLRTLSNQLAIRPENVLSSIEETVFQLKAPARDRQSFFSIKVQSAYQVKQDIEAGETDNFYLTLIPNEERRISPRPPKALQYNEPPIFLQTRDRNKVTHG